MPNLMPKTVLICDDEAYILESVSYVVRREGFNVLTADDGEKVLALAPLAADIGWVVYHGGNQRGRQIMRQNADTRTVAFLNETLVYDAIKTGQQIWTDNLTMEVAAPGVPLPRAFLCVPLKTRNEILGAICLGK